MLVEIAAASGIHTLSLHDALPISSDVENNALTASNLQIASGAGLLVDNGNGTWSYTPALNDDTSVSFSYTITDNGTKIGRASCRERVETAALAVSLQNDDTETTRR